MREIKKYYILVVFLISFVLFGCNSIKPLSLSHYGHDIIIQADNSIMIEKDIIDFRSFKEELTHRMVGKNDRVVLHVHIDVSDKVFDAVMEKLRDYGYKSVEPRLYK